MRHLIPVGVVVAALGLPTLAPAATDQSDWPKINGLFFMNQKDGSRRLDARPGRDPFAGMDRSYSWNQVAKGPCKGGGEACVKRLPDVDGQKRYAVPEADRHNELLGGHGDDTIFAGRTGDVIWGDYKPGGPKGQRDTLTGGLGKDYIYASQGTNTIKAGRGNDFVKIFLGRGTVDCGPGIDTLNISRRARKVYKISRCEKIIRKTIGR